MALCNRYTARLIFQHRCKGKPFSFLFIFFNYFLSTTVKIRWLLKSVRAREQKELCAMLFFYFLTVYHQSTVYQNFSERSITKFSYPWCSSSHAWSSTTKPRYMRSLAIMYAPELSPYQMTSNTRASKLKQSCKTTKK